MRHSIAPDGTRPVILSDRQGFDRRWFASGLQAVYVPTHAEQVADCLTAAIAAHGRDVKVTSGRHCYENFVYNDTTRAVTRPSPPGAATRSERAATSPAADMACCRGCTA